MAIKTSGRDGGGFWPQWEENKLFALLLAILLVYVIVFVGVGIKKSLIEMRKVGIADRSPATISVSATDSAYMVPDLATVDLGVTVQSASAETAQRENSTKVNALLDGLKNLGIPEKDIKTSSYNVYPRYDYDKSPAVVVGYEASQNVTVKIRDNALVGTVLEKAVSFGATNVGSLRFELDESDAVEAEAREKAIAKAYEQALTIADAMGARIGGVVSYSESMGGGYPYPVFYGRAEAAMDSAAPEIAPGENEVEMTVYIDFSLE